MNEEITTKNDISETLYWLRDTWESRRIITKDGATTRIFLVALTDKGHLMSKTFISPLIFEDGEWKILKSHLKKQFGEMLKAVYDLMEKDRK